MTLVKQVINNSGGNAVASSWMLNASGPTAFSGPGPSISSGSGLLPGTYDLAESGGVAGYSASAWICDGGIQVDNDTVTVALGEKVTCLITNDDISPTLKVIKTIVNDNGGTVTDFNVFAFKVDGGPVLHGVSSPFNAGIHTVSEQGLQGYKAGPWGR